MNSANIHPAKYPLAFLLHRRALLSTYFRFRAMFKGSVRSLVKIMTNLAAVPSLLLADDNPVFLQVLIEILEPDYEVVAALHEGASVLDKVTALCPDLVILDISLGDMTGLEVWRRIKAAGCTAKAIFVTVHEDIDFVNAAFDVGASGYVFKSRVSEDLQRAISTVFNGGRFVSGGLSLPPQAEKQSF